MMINHTRASYQLILLGSPGDVARRLRGEVENSLMRLGLPKNSIRFFDANDAGRLDLSVPVMAVFFGHDSLAVDTDLVAQLLEDSAVIAPVVSSLIRVSNEIPPQLRHINAVSLSAPGDAIIRLTTLIFETFRLLRRERRLFISYKRNGSQPLADRLYEALDARGFDVFIDVRSVPPATDFQNELWHRMTDSDVIILIDTPGFREGRWTAAELAQANATNVQILHLLWPGLKEDASSAFSHFLKLKRSDFKSYLPLRGRFIKDRSVEHICNEAERLRARALAARHRYLVDSFCDASRDLGLSVSVQVDGWILLTLRSGKALAIVPTVGVPKSDRINEIFSKISDPDLGLGEIWIIYDSRGILKSWLSHLDWLDTHLPIRNVQMAKVPERLSEAMR
ncbi:toll/interleukin-1 receptor domain-containing protein [Methylobacterium sp. J-077]|uniref:toll/interleukin-1 receptor domain-containing protein n=1 Tax=Methylobacterium sp. J-077 TaxID=2836656 RepID=UPI001FBB1A3A|nr:toll/interleukin-1 receptor domain-containing protein [Methylobacterium sp. J-077]MCJ2121270.1 toll/interleukin-1 receptor domain-containing protein [Methylobacterium sp. J-077]